MKLKPMDDRLLIKLTEEKEQTKGGIIIPDSAKEKPQKGEVIAVGTDEDLQQYIKAGDHVLFSKYAGQEVKIDDEEYLILTRGDILAIVEN